MRMKFSELADTEVEDILASDPERSRGYYVVYVEPV